MEPSTLAKIGFLTIGGSCVLCCLILGLRRRFLLWLGFGFSVVMVTVLVPAPYQWVPQLLAVTAFIVGIYEGVKDTRRRFFQQQAEQQDRERAFAEMMTAVMKKPLESSAVVEENEEQSSSSPEA